MTSATTIKAVTKAHAAGTVKISVTTPGGTVTSTGNFTFVDACPDHHPFTPTSGPTPGGTTVTITGTNLTGATSVKFGTTTAASYTVTSATTIKAVDQGPRGRHSQDLGHHPRWHGDIDARTSRS